VRSARGSDEREQHDARHIVEMSAGCASFGDSSARKRRAISDQGSAFSVSEFEFTFSIRESGTHGQ
jgi:hypothetical protein